MAKDFMINRIVSYRRLRPIEVFALRHNFDYSNVLPNFLWHFAHDFSSILEPVQSSIFSEVAVDRRCPKFLEFNRYNDAMNSLTIMPQVKTHEVLNQAPPLTGYNLFLSDKTLTQAVAQTGAEWANQQLIDLGRILGEEEAQRWGFEANENEPVLHTHDRYGNRRDEVVFHPGWHNLMRTSVEHHVHSLPWLEMKGTGKRPGAGLAPALRSAVLELDRDRQRPVA